MDNPKLLAAFGTASAIFLSGFYASSSQISIPPLLALPSKQSTVAFENVYYRGAKAVVPLTLVSSLTTGAAAYLIPHKRAELATAAVITALGLPWTQITMASTNSRMLALKESDAEREKAGEAEVTGLLQKWQALNFVRAGFGLMGGVVGMWALLA